jgi:hypothetical protein
MLGADMPSLDVPRRLVAGGGKRQYQPADPTAVDAARGRRRPAVCGGFSRAGAAFHELPPQVRARDTK